MLFRLFGRSLLVGRLFMILLFSVTTAGIYLLSRAVADGAVAAGSALLFAALSVHFWRIPNYSPEAIAWILFALAALTLYLRGGTRGWLAVAGLGLGAAVLFKQNYGALASLGAAAGLLAGRGPGGRRIADVALTAAAAAVPIALTLGAFAAAGAAGDLLHDVVLVPLRLPTSLFARPFPPLEGPLLYALTEYLLFQDLADRLMPWPYTYLSISMAFIRFVFYLPPVFLLVAALLALWRRFRTAPAEGARASIGVLHVATASFLFLGVFPRVDAHHLMMVLAPAFVVMAWMLGRRPLPAIRHGVLGGALAVFLLSSVSQAALLSRVNEPALLPFPRGGVWVPRREAVQVMGLIDEIHRRVPPGEPIFAAPALPMYYFLADRPNPTRFPLILPGALDEGEVIQTLAVQRVRHALVADVAFEEFTFEAVAPRVWTYVQRTFGPAEDMDWRSRPFPPYLRQRGAIDSLPPFATLRGEARPVRDPETTPWTDLLDLMNPSMSPPPPHRVVSRHPAPAPTTDQVTWGSMYLRPALVMRAPWGWRKTLAAWEVPARPGLGFEFAVALGPTQGPPPGPEGQGTVVEVWVAPASGGARPMRVWVQWVNPRRDIADRRWFRGIVDLGSYVTTPRAQVILVTGPAPTFDGYDGKVAWTALRLVQRGPSASPPDTPAADLVAGPVAVSEATARAILDFQPGDLPMFEEAAREYSRLAGAHAALADVAESLGRFDLVLEPRRRAVSQDPWNAVYRVRLAEALERAGRIEAAIVEMQAAARIEPRHPNYRAALAGLFQRLGRDAEARAWVDQALRLEGNHPWSLTILSGLELKKGNFAAAESAARRALEGDPANLRAWLDLAAALRGSGQVKGAKMALDRASALPLDPQERSFLARAYAEIDHHGEAAAEWRRVLAAVPPGALQEEARRELRGALERAPVQGRTGS
jgi:tetratricopeptide (TPR) repeat protein